ncbi:MAG: hypothetical protein IJ388_01340 [Oscillospiraceae bacterium]|nr:hypothetical protein [Oscillospiraceae bacterium]
MERIKQWLRHFMMGRYGTDKLSMTILGAGVIASIVAMFIPFPLIKMLLTLAAYVLMFWAIFRCFSRNTYKRYQENRKFLLWLDKIKDRQHKYYNCPRCRQPVRVPKGKGKIAISCPKCGEKFIRKS